MGDPGRDSTLDNHAACETLLADRGVAGMATNLRDGHVADGRDEREDEGAHGRQGLGHAASRLGHREGEA